MDVISERPITPAQIRSIHVAKARARLDDERYRAQLARFGASSCTELTRRQASELLLSFGRPLPNRPGRSKPRPERKRQAKLPANAVRLATRAQRELIEELAGRVEWREENGLARWMRANHGIDAARTDGEASAVIEGLKAMLRRAGRAE